MPVDGLAEVLWGMDGAIQAVAREAGGAAGAAGAEEEEEEEVDEELDAEAKKIASDLSGLGRNSGSDLKAVQKFGAQNPKAVAAVVKDWINE